MNKTLLISDKIILFPLWLLTLLPLRILYVFSDFIFLVLFHLVRYRRDVVVENLKNSFPEKDEKEIQKLTRRFYHYLCDYFIESIYLINMSEEECKKRYIVKNPELLTKLHKQEKNLVIATCHYGNWEWIASFGNWFPHSVYAIYKPLSNKFFDRLFIFIREKFGVVVVPMKKTLRTITGLIQKKELFGFCFVADQRPGKEDLGFWTSFLNQEAPVITGMDKLARRFDLSVVFMNVERPRRGYYEISLELIAEQPKATDTYGIAEKYIRSVESMVIAQPEFYFWTHKRWKYKAEEYKKVN